MQEVSETKRHSRNLSEKRRRDTFNVIITELAAIVACEGRKLDKSNVLRQTIAFLQKHRIRPGDSSPSGLVAGGIRETPTRLEWLLLLQRTLGVFLLVISDTGRILFVSDSTFESLKKACSLCQLGSFQLAIAYRVPAKANGSASSSTNQAPRHLKSTQNDEVGPPTTFRVLKYDKPARLLVLKLFVGVFSFFWHFRGARSAEPTKLTRVKVCGKFVPNNKIHQTAKRFETGCAFCCVCVPILSSPFNQSLLPRNDRQFTCVYNMEWTLLAVDENFMAITGWHPYEVVGRSGYEFYHPDDLDAIALEHEKLIDTKSVNMKPHRFQTKAGAWLKVESTCTIPQLADHALCVLWVHGDNKVCVQPSAAASKHQLESNGLDEKATIRVLKPQPGVSIEHSPFPLLENRIACESPPRGQSSDGIDLSAEEERLLCEQLMQRQANLQEQIVQYQTELRLLQHRLYMSLSAPLPEPTAPSTAYCLQTCGVVAPTVHTSTAMLSINTMNNRWCSEGEAERPLDDRHIS
ncbi:PAS 11 and HLH domain containing protein [Trichuris trichiura]|uniref:PAS 11 and HLH domain containing protein n=1 Tax=Trichuris trichiura TaxID=36087 RepID=A0A077Z0W9_TRITR|nr:PAS 11 and HLH domain containing protein [Trichuris trichiura]